MQKLKMIPCPKCGNDFPEKRKELGYHVCVNCSTTKPVVGITTVEGTGDHTWNDIIIMDQDRALAIQAKADELAGKKSTGVEILDFDNEPNENEVSQSLKDGTKNLLEGDEIEYDIFDPDKEPEGIKGIDY
jgi:hypothetical protein|tara:strand:- start:12948 stop:13340 length:393 start_codon:yes stop_codon:yes gene_type:complete